MLNKIMNSLRIYSPAVLSGILVILSAPGMRLGIFNNWLHWIALIPLFYAIRKSENFSRVYKLVFVTSFMVIGYGWSWLYSTIPLSWTGVNEFLPSFGIVSFFWVTNVAFSTMFFSLWTWFYCKLRGTVFEPLLLAMGWAAFELVLSIVFSIYSYGTGLRIGEFYSFGNLGYHLHSTPLIINLASIGGVYLLSFLVAFGNGLILYFLPKKNIKFFLRYESRIPLLYIMLYAAVLLGAGYLAGIPNKVKTDKSISYTAIQTNYSADQKLDEEYVRNVNQTLYTAVSKHVMEETPQIIVLPEYSGFLHNIENVPVDVVKNYVYGLLRDPKRTLILNNRSESNNASLPQNITFSVNAEVGVISGYAKVFVTPLGENIPLFVEPLLDLFIRNSESRDHYKKFRRYQSGANTQPLKTPYGYIAALPCSEIYTTSVARKLVRNGGEIIIAPANNAIFHYSPMIFATNEAVSKLRAVETNRYLIQVPNAAYTYVISNEGKVVYKADKLDMTAIHGSAPLISKKTFYTYTGNWPSWVSLLGLVVLVVRQRRQSNTPIAKKPSNRIKR